MLEEDRRARLAREALDRHLAPGLDRVRWLTYEWLVETADRIGAFSGWAGWFRRRYLDLGPVRSR